MAALRRPPVPALRPLVDTVWASEAEAPSAASRQAIREHVLPTGTTHIAVRLGGPPLLVFDSAGDRYGHRLGHAVVGGPRVSYHVREVPQTWASVGAMLKPGAAAVLLGVPASALAGHHTALEDLTGTAVVDDLQEQLVAKQGAEGRLACFERWLEGRARARVPTVHAAVARMLARPFSPDEHVQDLVRASGLSHRHFIAQVRLATGLAPGDWLRTRRFSCALELAATSALGWADIAAASGFADQAHLTHVFHATTGYTPSAWRSRMDPAAPRHVRG